MTETRITFTVCGHTRKELLIEAENEVARFIGDGVPFSLSMDVHPSAQAMMNTRIELWEGDVEAIVK